MRARGGFLPRTARGLEHDKWWSEYRQPEDWNLTLATLPSAVRGATLTRQAQLYTLDRSRHNRVRFAF
eukprot:526717-Prymnesium_polylepis.1